MSRSKTISLEREREHQVVLTRRGQCYVCGRRVAEEHEFLVSVDMFAPNDANYLKGDLLKEVKAWRKSKLLCEDHQNE